MIRELKDLPPLVELIEKEKLPASVHLLRPPTFDRLREHLLERPHFYHLIHFDGHGSVTRGSRGQPGRQDWLVPVVYQQDPYDFAFADKAKVEARRFNLPEEVQDHNNPYGLVGREGPILELERAMRRPPAGILIQGLGGVGKTEV